MEVHIIFNELYFLLLFFSSHWWCSFFLFFLFYSPWCYLRQTWCSHTVLCSAGEGQKVMVMVTLTFLFIFLLLFLGGCRGNHLHLRHLVAVPMTPEVWSWPFQLHEVKVVVLIWAIPIIINQHYLVNNFTLLSNYTTAWVHINHSYTHTHTHTHTPKTTTKEVTNKQWTVCWAQAKNKQKLSITLNPDPKQEKENHQILQKQSLQKRARTHTHTHN